MIRLFACADLGTAQWSAEERCEHTEVKYASGKRYQSNDQYDYAGRYVVDSKKAPNNQSEAYYDAYNTTISRSHERYKRVHVFFLLLSDWLYYYSSYN